MNWKQTSYDRTLFELGKRMDDVEVRVQDEIAARERIALALREPTSPQSQMTMLTSRRCLSTQRILKQETSRAVKACRHLWR